MAIQPLTVRLGKKDRKYSLFLEASLASGFEKKRVQTVLTR